MSLTLLWNLIKMKELSYGLTEKLVEVGMCYDDNLERSNFKV